MKHKRVMAALVATALIGQAATATTASATERKVPNYVTCNLIHSQTLWHICYVNINRYHAHWQYVGKYDGHKQVWMIPGPTSVFVNRHHWAESS